MTHQKAKESPIIFSTSMVQAILEGRKTQTRRIVKGTALPWLKDGFTPEFVAMRENSLSPYGYVGDLLWVRENVLYTNFWFDEEDTLVKYLANNHETKINLGTGRKPLSRLRKTIPSIHMPKAAARIWLQIEGLRIERLQDITEEDAISEGTTCPAGFDAEEDAASLLFSLLWESIHGPDSWEANPWVWAITFKVISTSGKPETLNPKPH